MNSGIISMRYARALLDFAQNKNVEVQLFSEMKTLSESFSRERNLRLAMDNPVLPIQDKTKLICSAVGLSPSPEFVHFVQFVLHQRRQNHLQTIALIYMDLYRKSKKISVAKLVTAVPASNETIDKMKSLFSTRSDETLEFDTEIDPTIEGGFILYADTYRLDASVTTQIRKIKQQLIVSKTERLYK